MNDFRPWFDRYHTSTGPELIYRYGDRSFPQVILIEAFFEERNFLRRTLVLLAHQLGKKGIASAIPDLPGTGESLTDLASITFTDWQHAITSATTHISADTKKTPHIASFRGGALLDRQASGESYWRFAPATGEEILRQMRRIQHFGNDDNFAGYSLSKPMEAAMEAATLLAPSGPLRHTDVLGSGAPLWRRSEPDGDEDLACRLADDLVLWIGACAKG